MASDWTVLMHFGAASLERLLRQTLPWVAVVLAAVIVLFWAVRRFRGRFGDDGRQDGPTWTFQQLREMHARGELGDAEFELLKVRAIADAADRQLWTLEDLRGMHARGELADDEFELAKARLIAAVNADGGAGLGNQAHGPSGPRRPA